MEEVFIVLRSNGVYPEGHVTDVYSDLEYAQIKIADHIIEWCRTDGNYAMATGYCCSSIWSRRFEESDRYTDPNILIDNRSIRPSNVSFYNKEGKLVYTETVVVRSLKTKPTDLKSWLKV